MRSFARSFTLACVLGLSTSALAIAPTKNCFPENDLYKQDCLDCENASMTEAQFKNVMAQVQAVYAPIAKSQGGVLKIQGDWKDPTVNAYASKEGNVWNVSMFGGLARRPETTLDGFMLVVCHEVGHHLGGYPFYSESDMASEGQSDYFATQACAKKIWGRGVETLPAPASYKSWCQARGGDVTACTRSLLAGDSLAQLLAKLNGEKKPQYNTPDNSISTRTYEGHPKAQQRLDTYLAGLVCGKIFPTTYRPGMATDGVGYNTIQAEREALGVSCQNRPRSWFKPLSY